jgi:phospholipid-binding lipoprotein MlaA
MVRTVASRRRKASAPGSFTSARRSAGAHAGVLRARSRRLLLVFGLAALSLAAGPAAATANDQALTEDRFETLNRVIFYANGVLDLVLIRPSAMTYKRLTPRLVRTGLNNAFSNMGEPTVAVNDALQGHGKKMVHTVSRLAMNSTLGLAGLLDVARRVGLAHHDNDFGITLAHYGVRSGPYLVLPILGPSTLRDAVGLGINVAIDPLVYIRYPQSTAVTAARAVDVALVERANADPEIKLITASATDDYAAIRSLYLQSRAAEVSGGRIDLRQLPDFGDP